MQVLKHIITVIFVVSMILVKNASAAVIDLPDNTPGLREQKVTKKINEKMEECIHVVIPATDAFEIWWRDTKAVVTSEDLMKYNGNIYFPCNGVQPTTEEAAEYSCANVEDENITNWYVQAFGGDEAVKLSKEGELTVNGVKWGFDSKNVPKNIITVDTSSDTSPDFEKQFWETFRVIASDPVGRVLLYRILIEIRRQKKLSGTCEETVTAEYNILKNRNKCRSIKIKEASDEGFSFSRGNRTIEFDYKDRKIDTLKFENNSSYPYIIYTTNDSIDDSLDIGLFHEMIHWFHYLRHPKRFIYSDYAKPDVYKYLMRSFYGDQSELCTWGNIDDEEIRTILGSPNYNDSLTLNFINSEAFLKEKASTAIDYIEVNVNGENKFIPKDDMFLNGDDLSDNVYRLCRAQKENVAYKMRYSHGGNINKIFCLEIPIRFKLAHKITSDCYSNITKLKIHNWNLTSKQAVQ